MISYEVYVHHIYSLVCWFHSCASLRQTTIGATHSIIFAVALSLAVCIGLGYFQNFKSNRLILSCFLGLFFGIAAHGVVDAMTIGGLGVNFFWPLSCERFFFSFRPIEVSPLSVSRFFDQAIFILKNEILWIWIPCGTLLFLNSLLRRFAGSSCSFR